MPTPFGSRNIRVASLGVGVDATEEQKAPRVVTTSPHPAARSRARVAPSWSPGGLPILHPRMPKSAPVAMTHLPYCNAEATVAIITALLQSRRLANREVPPMMDRRIFLTTVAGLLAAPLAARSQQAGKVYRVGFLGYAATCDRPAAMNPFRQGLGALGYVEGRGVRALRLTLSGFPSAAGFNDRRRAIAGPEQLAGNPWQRPAWLRE